MAMCSKMAAVPAGNLPHVSHDKDDRYMVTIQVPGRGLGLGSLSTIGADVQVGVWPDQQQAGQDAHQRFTTHLLAPPPLESLLLLILLVVVDVVGVLGTAVLLVAVLLVVHDDVAAVLLLSD